MNDNQLKFQNLLRELFQSDYADLDFGIYRIMNHKRAIIEKFISEDLPQRIREELEKEAMAEQEQAVWALQKVQKKVLEALDDNTLDANSQLISEEYRNTNTSKDYIAAQQQAAKSRSHEALESIIYNHLYAFFSRYWQEGDFISKHRYSKKERYAIPYNGEEVTLYWANRDQYYVKTGEYFTNYTYKTPNGVTTHFKLCQADVEQNNVKGKKRFFLPRLDEITWDEAARQVVIPFEYRLLTAQEAISYGQRNQQEAILTEAVAEIPKRIKALQAITTPSAEWRKTETSETVTYLEHHLRRYTHRTTSDFFIHKDLKGFLSRELDFYLKNEVLNLEELEAAGEGLSESWFQLLRLIKRVGLHIIEFLAQIEDFQKMLWEKKKFITEVFYLVTVGNIPEVYYAEIVACEAQWEEWRTLFDLETPKATKERIELLKAHPTLVLDTRYLSTDFTDRLLTSFDNLDESIDGLLVHSENWQALNLLQEKYREWVKCIYIDPPFNTGDDFLYKDSFRNSSWIELLYDRLRLSLRLFSPDANYFIHLDHNAVHYGKLLLADVFSELNEIIFNTNATKDEESGLFSYKSFGKKFVRQHDTILHGYNSTVNFMKLWKPNRNTSKLGLGQLDLISCPKVNSPKKLDDFIFYVERFQDGILGKHTIDVNDEKIFPIGDIWNDLYSFTQSEMRVSENLSFLTQKPENLIRRIIQTSTVPSDLVLDFFAGSGTTAAVCHKLFRKYIAVEMGDYFETVYDVYDNKSGAMVQKLGILGRMKNVLHGDTTFNACGKNRRSTLSKQISWGGGGLIKCIRLESYEDALNNLTFEEQSGQRALELFRDDHLLSYMLRWETRHSETLLNVEQLQAPFSYKLHLHRDGKTRERIVDLPETFAYLLGLNVWGRKVYINTGGIPAFPGESCTGNAGVSPVHYLVYRGALRNGRTVVIFWRDISVWGVADYEREAAFVTEQNLIAGADEIYVNGDSRIPGARSLDPIFKERMFAPVEM